MPVYHIVLFKLQPTVTATQITEFTTAAKSMVGQIPGLKSLEAGPPLVSTAHRALGFDMGIVAVLDGKDDVEVYAKHPAHLVVHRLREEMCHETLAFDLEF